MNLSKRLELAKWAVDYAQKQGATQAKANISNQRSVQIEFRDKKLETIKESTQSSLALNIFYNNRYSGHSTNNLDKKELERFISEAVAATKYLAQDKYRRLPDTKYYPSEMPDLGLFDENYSALSSEKRIKIASAIEREAMQQSNKIISSTGSFSDGSYRAVQVHSNGFEGTMGATYYSAGASVTVKDKDGRPEDWCYASDRFFKNLPDPDKLGKEAAKRALEKIGQRKIASGKYDMLVENRSASRLLYMLNSPLSARALQQKSSYLDGMLNKKIASEKLSITDNPFVQGGMGSRLFDGDGIALKKRPIIEKGVLKNYYIDWYYGQKLGMQPNGSSPTNLIFGLGDKTLEDLIRSIEKGILVSGFNGGNSNSTTGDFSFGVSGFLIENGKILHPVNEMIISGNANDLWNNLAQVGNDPYPYSSMKRPSLLFKNTEFSGL